MSRMPSLLRPHQRRDLHGYTFAKVRELSVGHNSGDFWQLDIPVWEWGASNMSDRVSSMRRGSLDLSAVRVGFRNDDNSIGSELQA